MQWKGLIFQAKAIKKKKKVTLVEGREPTKDYFSGSFYLRYMPGEGYEGNFPISNYKFTAMERNRKKDWQ